MTDLTPDVAVDYCLLPETPIMLDRGIDEEGIVAVPAVTPDLDVRIRLWCRIVGQKGVWSPSGIYDPCATIPDVKPTTRSCVLFGLGCGSARHFEPPSLLCDAVAKTRAFMNPKKTFLHALYEAWVLAGVEAAMHAGMPCTETIFNKMEGGCTLAICVQQRVAHVTRYAQWVGINVPVPTQAETLDYLYMDRDGRFHVCMVSTTGSAVDTARQDLLTAFALISHLKDGVKVCSVRVLYVLRNESVVVETDSWCPDRLWHVLVHGMREWHADEYEIFAHCTSSRTEVFKPASGNIQTAFNTEDMYALANGRRIIAWHYIDFAGNDRRFDNDVYDVQTSREENGPTSAQDVYALYRRLHAPCIHTIGFVRQYANGH